MRRPRIGHLKHSIFTAVRPETQNDKIGTTDTPTE
jgi:hypothetical protein